MPVQAAVQTLRQSDKRQKTLGCSPGAAACIPGLKQSGWGAHEQRWAAQHARLCLEGLLCWINCSPMLPTAAVTTWYLAECLAALVPRAGQHSALRSARHLLHC